MERTGRNAWLLVGLVAAGLGVAWIVRSADALPARPVVEAQAAAPIVTPSALERAASDVPARVVVEPEPMAVPVHEAEPAAAATAAIAPPPLSVEALRKVLAERKVVVKQVDGAVAGDAAAMIAADVQLGMETAAMWVRKLEPVPALRPDQEIAWGDALQVSHLLLELAGDLPQLVASGKVLVQSSAQDRAVAAASLSSSFVGPDGPYTIVVWGRTTVIQLELTREAVPTAVWEQLVARARR